MIRGDSDTIVIGDDSNVQDGTIIHVDDGIPTHIGKRVAIGHRAIVHGATIEDDCLIAMGAILLNGVHVGTGSIVGAGAVCREGMFIPPNSLVLGVPGKVVRETTDADRDRIQKTVQSYWSSKVDTGLPDAGRVWRQIVTAVSRQHDRELRVDRWTGGQVDGRLQVIVRRLFAAFRLLGPVHPSTCPPVHQRGSPRLSTSNYGTAHNRDVHFVTPRFHQPLHYYWRGITNMNRMPPRSSCLR